MAAGDLCTVRAVQDDLGLAAGSDAGPIPAWISGASSWIVAFLSQPILTTAWSNLVYDGRGAAVMVLPYWPVQSIQALSIDGRPVNAGTPGSTDSGYFYDTRGIVRLRGLVFSRGVGNVVVSYTSGYATVPPALERACVRMVSWRYRERDRIGHASKSIQGETVAFQTAAAETASLQIFEQFKRVVPG